MTGRRLCLLILLAAVLPSIRAQKVPFENFTIQNGLPQSTVNDICQDAAGYLWFATQMGAARYDGYEFTYFSVASGLPDNNINCLLDASDGSVWLGTEGGLARFDGEGFRTYGEADGLVSDRIDRIDEDLEGNIWVGTAYGISVITPDSVYSYTKNDALSDNTVMELLVDSRGRVHVSTFPHVGLTIFSGPAEYEKLPIGETISDMIETPDGSIWYATQEAGILVSAEGTEEMERLGMDEGLTDLIVLSLMVDHRDRIWCGTYTDGLFVYEGGRFRRVSAPGGDDPLASRIMEDSHHRIWVHDFLKGVWLVDERGYRRLTESNSLVYDVVTDILEDRNGNIWIATLNGVSKYGRVLFEVYDTDGVLPDNNVLSLYYDSRDRLWFGTYHHLLYMKNDRFYQLGEKNGFRANYSSPLSFAEDRLGHIFIGTDRGLLYYNGRSVEEKQYWGKESSDLQFFSLLYAEDGSLWCGTDSGVYVVRNGQAENPPGNRQLPYRQVNAIDIVEDRVYCATEGGLAVMNTSGEHLVSYTLSDSLASDVCNDVTHDGEGNIWVATDGGVSRISEGPDPVITTYRMSDGMKANAVYFLEFNEPGLLWLGTERGLFRLHTASGKTDYYGTEEGYYPLDNYRGAVTPGQGREMWFGTVSGLVHYLPFYHEVDPIPPELILYPPLVGGKEYRPEDESQEPPVFSYKDNSLTFHFTGIHTTLPSRNRFSFFLEGYEDEWSDQVADRSVSYRKIPNGQYVFRVKAYNLDGIPTATGARFEFSIKPPFWKTAWFIILEILTGLLLIYAIIKQRERALVREKRILEERVRERTREIEEQKVEIEAQRDEISGQKRFVEDQRDQIAQQNKEITDSIQYARHIQQAVLPGKIALERTLPEHFIFFRPRDIVSGDFYWVEQKQDRILVCAADCTGHGVPGAFMSLLGLTFLNEIVNKDEILKASEILNRLRSYIMQSMSHKDRQARDGMDVSLVVIDPQLNQLEYAGAYNPLVIIRKGELIEYKADKMPIGRHEGEERAFTSHRVSLQEGDCLYLFSDGFPDQFGGEKMGKYKAKPFRRLLQRIHAEPMEKQEQLLEQELSEWMGDLDQLDDILVMGLRYSKKNR